MKRILLTTVIALLSMAGAMAQNFDYQGSGNYNLKYSVNEDNNTVTCMGMINKNDAGSADLVIPETVENGGTTYSVTTIGERAFSWCSGLTGSLTIGDAVTSIGDYAFYKCSALTGSLTIPNSVTSIGDYAFFYCSGLTGSLTICDAVTSIGEDAFENCSGFTGSLTIGSSVDSIGKDAFLDCSGFTGSLTIPNSVESIGNWAFSDCSGFTGSLTIGSSVEGIGDYAFKDCSGLSLLSVLSTTPPTFGSDAFDMSYIKAIYVPKGARTTYIDAEGWKDFVDDCHFIEIGDDTEVISINVATAGTLSNELDAIGKHPRVVTHLELSGTLGTDDWYLIKNNMTALYDLDLSEITNTEIPDEAFRDSKIFHFAFPQGLISIGSSAFSGSNLIGELHLPNSVTAIGDDAFSYCSGFTGSLTIPNSVTSIGDYAFKDCSGFTGSLTIPNSVTSIGDYAFSWCSGFTGSLTIPNSVTSIGDRAFSWCRGFTGSLTIPNSVESIGDYAFCDCSGLTGTLTIGENVESIGANAFDDCSDISNVIMLRETPPTVGDNAFANMAAGISVYVPAAGIGTGDGKYGEVGATWNGLLIKIPTEGDTFSVTTDEGYELKYTVNAGDTTVTLTGMNKETKAPGEANLVIPATVSVGKSLAVTAIGDNAFKDCSGFTGTLTIGENVESIGKDAFSDCSGFTGSLAIPNSVTSIGNWAFGMCSGFTGSLTIGNAVTSIGDRVFYNCSGFTGSLTIPNSVESIGIGAFSGGCSGFTGTLTIGENVESIGEWAFSSCKGLTAINVDNANANYSSADGILYNKNKTTVILCLTGKTGSLTIPNTVTSIGDYAFYGCYGFTGTLTIGENVESIGEDAFDGCYNISGVTMLSVTPPTVGDNAFYGTRADIIVYVPAAGIGAVADGKYGEVGADWYGFTVAKIPTAGDTFSVTTAEGYELNYTVNAGDTTVTLTGMNKDTKAPGEANLVIPATVSVGKSLAVTAIGDNAFKDCSGFTGSLAIPNSVTSIGERAFYGCSKISGVTMLCATPPTVGAYAFVNMKAGISVTVPAGTKDAYDGDDNGTTWQGMTIIDPLLVAQATKIAEVNALADGLTEADYTAESWKAFTDAMQADIDAINTKTTVEDVDAYELTAIAAKEALEEDVPTSVADATAAPFTRVQNTLYFAQPTDMAVYNVSGMMLYSGKVTAYELPSAAGVYIIRTANGSVKVMSK